MAHFKSLEQNLESHLEQRGDAERLAHQEEWIKLPKQNDFQENLLKKLNQTSYCEEDFKGLLRQINLKVTQQRLLILHTLNSGNKKHVTAQELFEQVKIKDQKVGFATVYRMLRKLVDVGLVLEVRVGNAPTRYELTPRLHHDHLNCVRCGKIVEFHDPDLEKLQELIAKKKGFILTHHLLELYGVCQSCLKK